MAQDFGTGVSRTLSALRRQFEVVVWQQNKPPLDSELNLMGQVDWERVAEVVRSSMHSGFLADAVVADTDFVTNSSWSNFFNLGRQAPGELAPILWANVNGWLLPVTGTMNPNGVTGNRVNLFPPPSSDARIDLVFLEVWMAQLAPNPSTANKPSASTIWKYGNVMFGGTNEPDDLEDPTIGFETTERVQLQYRIRVYGSGSGLGASVDLAVYPDGLDDPNVVAQGTAAAPVAGFPFLNMRDVLGDPGLWRAGNGVATNALGTVDGYVYAIPIAAVFRRNTLPFAAVTSGGNANQNGALNRNPNAVAITNPAQGATVLGSITLTSAITATTTGSVNVTGLIGSGLDNPAIDWTSTFLVLDNEIISISGVNTGTGTITIRPSPNGRGRYNTQANPHAAGTSIQFFNFRPDGLFADQIAPVDILDLRRSVNLGDWDHEELLLTNLTRLFKNDLRTSYKQSGVVGGDVQGVVIPEVDYLFANGAVAVPNQTEALDGPDGIRTVFSDAAVAESSVSVLLTPPTSAGAVANFAVATGWDVGAGFVPDGFSSTTAAGWRDGTVVNLYIGGQNGNQGARATVRNAADNRIARFVTPKEYWISRRNQDGQVQLNGNQTPVTLRFIGSATAPNAGIATEGLPPGGSAQNFPGPVYPLPEFNFEKPYIVLGGVVNSLLNIVGTASAYDSTISGSGYPEIELTGIDFDIAGDWYATAGITSLDPNAVANPLLHGTRTLYDMLTDGGQDRSGASSEVYIVLTGDTANPTVNNGVFRVIGVGTAGYTTVDASAANRVAVEFIRGTGGPTNFLSTPPNNPIVNLTAIARSQYTSAQDDNGRATGPSAMTVVLTDISGATNPLYNPWSATNLGAYALTQPVNSPLEIDTTVLYGPSRGGTARVANQINRVAVVSASDTFLRVVPGALDVPFAVATGVPQNEIYFQTQGVQTWNRLTSLGLNGPFAPAYGGQRIGFTEQDRDTEVFVDEGSKTVIFRPFVERTMTLTKRTAPATLIPASYTGVVTTDGAGMFATTAPGVYNLGFALPPQYMPRFGRQDIPFRTVDPAAPAAGPFLYGINHLFVDAVSSPAYNNFGIIGGPVPAAAVTSLLLQTSATSGLTYGEYGPVSGGGNAYQSRLYSNVNIISTDLGWRMQGIQLPPFLGIARLYAVYEAADYAANGSAFQSDRVTARPGGATNLLDQDATLQTLYILQGGAEDVTGNANDHTYIIPSNVINIERWSGYISGTTTFTSLEYVVEFTAFGFARGFINRNNYVLSRTALPGGASVPNAIIDAEMVLNAAATYGTQLYVEYDRTVYQGDPYMTRDGSIRTTSDYQTRYGQVPQVGAYDLNFPIQQYSFTGQQIPQKVNPRPLEILASVDFYTTLGTGKIGGPVYAGTVTDVGHITDVGAAPTRIPSSALAEPWESETRTFTEAQPPNGPRASTSLTIVNNASMVGEAVIVNILDQNGVTVVSQTFTAVAAAPVAPQFLVGVDASATAANLATVISQNTASRFALGVTAISNGPVVEIFSTDLGQTRNIKYVRVVPASGNRFVAGMRLNTPTATLLPPGSSFTQVPMTGGFNAPVNATLDPSAATPISMTGLTERLPLGILVQDSDFIGEDPLRNGLSALYAKAGSATMATNLPAPLFQGTEYDRLNGSAGQYIALSDGAILLYQPYDAVSRPAGTQKFRLFRGGGSTYMIGPEGQPGGPVEWEAGSFTEADLPVLKGAVLAGRAFLVRNYHETAFAGNDTTTHGDELQMVIVTRAVYGNEGMAYELVGQMSPTGYGEGYTAADRYRLVGKPLDPGHSRVAPPVDIPLAPYPCVDPSQPCPPCPP